MGAHSLAQMAPPQPSAVTVEAGLLNLFAPAFSSGTADSTRPRTEHTALWRADAVHRAKNMAQMAIALATIADRSARTLVPIETVAGARRLARAYDALAADEGCRQTVPCATLMAEVVCGLVDIFGSARGVVVRTTIDAVSLVPAARRALILIGSELTINALKYGFPGTSGGAIAVRLTGGADGVCLEVEDDGIGGAGDAPGQGSGLIAALAVILQASVTRSAGQDGRGLRVRVSTRVGGYGRD